MRKKILRATVGRSVSRLMFESTHSHSFVHDSWELLMRLLQLQRREEIDQQEEEAQTAAAAADQYTELRHRTWTEPYWD